MEQSAKNANGEILLGWLRKLPRPSDKKVEIYSDCCNKLALRIYMADNSYSIMVTDSYLGCIVSNRRFRPGENWIRSNSLPSGPFCWNTFSKIMNAIVCYELKEVVKLHKQPEAGPDTEKRISPEMVDAMLRLAGHDPDETEKRTRAVAERAVEECEQYGPKMTQDQVDSTAPLGP